MDVCLEDKCTCEKASGWAEKHPHLAPTPLRKFATLKEALDELRKRIAKARRIS